MALAQFVVTVEYTPRDATTTVEVESVLRDSISTGLRENTGHIGGGLSSESDFILDQYEIVPVVGGSLSNPK
jgi:hypothetical protein